ncbi:MAG: nicotinate phosphoribosyltransferase [Legionellales bacterium]|nr:nicotinate phosphoribosyltransferase [Legionellales bacterium]|tara:strand:+ start:10500 stop:11660 length:1161 start_codon:yes stop_codon:yes gene_type:complete
MIIESLLDTDLYKFTMMQAVLHQFPGAMVQYRFKCRNEGVDLAPYAEEIKDEIKALCQLRFSNEEINYLSQFSFFKTDYLDFLRIFQLNDEFIAINTDNGFELDVKGPWLHTIMFEVPLLAIISEVYFRNTQPDPNYTEGKQRLADKIIFLKNETPAGEFKFSEFGTRRRFSREWQEYVIKTLGAELAPNLIGTSNVYYAKEFGMTPIGTMAHEYLQACQTLGPRLVYSQKFAFEKWAQEYRGELGIALSDVYGLEAFINDFDLYFCKLFDGARHDSGDPFEWGERLIEHYQQFRIDPKTKQMIFSDNLSFKTAIEIFWRFKDRINVAFGIGTNLTNDLGYTALQNVIKMIYCNGQPVAKVSDTPEKTMCPDASYLEYLKQVFKIG